MTRHHAHHKTPREGGRGTPLTVIALRALLYHQDEVALRTHARVVIIGGGVMGAGLLYHLALEGWTDTVLVEKGELTSGSTWHAAGQCPHFNSSLNMTRVHVYGT